jgi:cytochrome c peroxidase
MAAAICESPTYPQLFEKAFGTQDITAVRFAFAIATHERTLISSDTPWDRFNAGDLAALTPQQEAGRVVYFNAGQCARCHPAPRFANDTFVNLGFVDSAFDRGREGITLAASDLGKFQVATARNAGLREAAGLLHDGIGAGASLQDLMLHYNNPPGVDPMVRFPNTDVRMQTALGMTGQQVADLVEFVRNGLTDPRVRDETYPFNRPMLGSE